MNSLNIYKLNLITAPQLSKAIYFNYLHSLSGPNGMFTKSVQKTGTIDKF